MYLATTVIHQREVVGVGRISTRGQEGLELEVAEPEGRGLGWHVGASDVVGR
jgi:hypothetical protein